MADKVIEIFEMTDGIMKSGMSEKETSYEKSTIN